MMPESMSISKALNATLAEAMRADDSIILMGEDIAGYGGVFGVTRGLLKEFGAERVIDTPIAEAGFVGLATGAALGGLRPVIEIMWGDFTFVAADQLINQAAKAAYFWNRPLPLVVRIQQGTTAGAGPQHSQCVEVLLGHYPGFQIAAPATPQDARELLLHALTTDQPTIFLENRRIYAKRGPVDRDAQPLPFGQAAIRRTGTDITIVSYSGSVHDALDAAETLMSLGIDAEVVDLRTVIPLDIETVRRSAQKTGAVLVAHEDYSFASVGSEIIAQLACRQTPDDSIVRFARVAATPEPAPVRLDQWQAWATARPEGIVAAAQTLVAKETVA